MDLEPTTADLDAELLRLAVLLDVAVLKEREAHARAARAEERGASGAEIEAEAERHVVEAGVYVEQMIKLPATTWPGLYAKARAVAWCLGGDDELAISLADEGLCPDERLARSVVNDLLRMQCEELPISKAPTTSDKHDPN